MCNSTPGATALLQGNSGMHVLRGMPDCTRNEGTEGIRKKVTVDSQAREIMIVRTAGAQRHNESEVKETKTNEGRVSYLIV